MHTLVVPIYIYILEQYLPVCILVVPIKIFVWFLFWYQHTHVSLCIRISAEGQRALVLIAMEVITRYFYLRSIMIYFFVMSYIGINSCSINYKVIFVMLSTSLYFLGKYSMHKWWNLIFTYLKTRIYYTICNWSILFLFQ